MRDCKWYINRRIACPCARQCYVYGEAIFGTVEDYVDFQEGETKPYEEN